MWFFTNLGTQDIGLSMSVVIDFLADDWYIVFSAGINSRGGTEDEIKCTKCFEGKGEESKSRGVNSEVLVQLKDGTEIVSIITKSSAENLDLKEGKEVYAIIKASNVILATD